MDRRIIIALLAGTAALSACKKDPPAQLPPDPQPSISANQGGLDNNGNTGSAAAALGTQAHFVEAVSGQNVIYFDTDRYNVDSADAAALQVQAQYLLRYPNIEVTLEGHADERGTREYNLALGERRANAAKNYLVSLGIPVTRIRTISYGKEKPVALGSNESAWAQNRRAVTVVID